MLFPLPSLLLPYGTGTYVLMREYVGFPLFPKGLVIRPTSLTRWHGDESTMLPGPDALTRTMEYDSLGRMTVNRELSTSEGTLEDYSPCEVHHVPYSPLPEVEYHYDVPDPEADAALPAVGR